ncbi:MAG: hypothetical protein ABI947_19280 [Chloroflexota bacterium]
MLQVTTSLELADCLREIIPVELQGVELLKQFRHNTGAWFPQVPAAIIIEATTQMIAYTKDCAAAVWKLQVLPPTTLATLPCREFCL